MSAPTVLDARRRSEVAEASEVAAAEVPTCEVAADVTSEVSAALALVALEAGAVVDAARLGAARATVAGSSVLLPAERRLGSLDAAAAYAARVLALSAVVQAVGSITPPSLRVRRGVWAAHWEPPGTIALPVPVHGEPWALHETVLLHELAHHVGETAGLSSGHRAPFPALVLLLAEAALGAEAAFALRVDYGELGVAVGRL